MTEKTNNPGALTVALLTVHVDRETVERIRQTASDMPWELVHVDYENYFSAAKLPPLTPIPATPPDIFKPERAAFAKLFASAALFHVQRPKGIPNVYARSSRRLHRQLQALHRPVFRRR